MGEWVGEWGGEWGGVSVSLRIYFLRVHKFQVGLKGNHKHKQTSSWYPSFSQAGLFRKTKGVLAQPVGCLDNERKEPHRNTVQLSNASFGFIRGPL